MNKIIAPLRIGLQGAAVDDLQAALRLLLDRGLFLNNDDGARRELTVALDREKAQQNYGDATAKLVSLFQEIHHLEPTGEVDEATANAFNTILAQLGAFGPPQAIAFKIVGHVEFEDGTSAIGYGVTAYDRDLGKSRVALGDSENPTFTDENGDFPAILYRAEGFVRGEGKTGPNADLVFEVAGPNEPEPHSIVSIFRRFTIGRNVQDVAVADLVLGFEANTSEDVRIVLSGRPATAGQSEYGRLMDALGPLLEDGRTPAEFDQQEYRDIDFAARETAWAPALIETMVEAWRLARAASQEPQRLAETFYGLLRQDTPATVSPVTGTLDEIFLKIASWRPKLEDSIALAFINGSIETHLAHLRDIQTEIAMRTSEDRQGSSGDILRLAGFDDDSARTLLKAFHAYEGDLVSFWTKTMPQQGWDKSKIEVAQTTLFLADLLTYDMPLLKLVRERVQKPVDLVAIDRAAWVDMIAQVGPTTNTPGETLEAKITCTVDAIVAQIATTWPNQTMARFAMTSPDAELMKARDLLGRFLANEVAGAANLPPDDAFDIRSTPVPIWLETHGNRVFEGMGDADQELLTAQLNRLQRVYRLSVDHEQVEALIANRLDSAFHIAKHSPEYFASQFGNLLGGADRATKVYARAEKIAGTITWLYIDLWQGIHDVQPLIISGPNKAADVAPLKKLPAYKAFFGNVDLCACKHCQSTLSPAAYFIDLMHMLDQKLVGALNPVDVLLRRRPDLAQIQLTCANTNTLIPYVDLANEILESFVANGAPTAFNTPPPRPNHVLASPSAEELRANPVYLTDASEKNSEVSYAVLQDAVFPLTLPLNLHLETVRAYLGHLGINRADLMAVFEPEDGLTGLMARAAEILLLSPQEYELLTGERFDSSPVTPAPPIPELFGLMEGPDAATAFNHVTPFFSGLADGRSTLISSLQTLLGIGAPVRLKVTEKYDDDTKAAVNAVLTKHGLPANSQTDAVFWGAMESDGKKPLSVIVCPVRMALDRLGLTYPELITLVKTRFMNPNLQGTGDYDYLARLGIPVADIRVWLQSGFGPMPAAITTALVALGEDVDIFTRWVEARRKAVVLNADFNDPCDLDHTILMHLDGTLLTPNELFNLSRFVRLWRKLGWTIDELDLVVDHGAFEADAKALILLLANVHQLKKRLGISIAEIVALWNPIPTFGASPLYDKLFCNRAAQLIDKNLALNPERTDLAATGLFLDDHVATLLAAFRLTAEELAAVRIAAGLEAAAAPLNLKALSAIHAYCVVARGLQLTVRELLILATLADATPFARPDRSVPGDLLVFTKLVDKFKSSNVSIDVIDYLCRVMQPASGLPKVAPALLERMIAIIISGQRNIASELPDEVDPDGFSLEAALTPILGPNDSKAIVALILGRDVYTVELVGLPANLTFPLSLKGRVSYDATAELLTLRGALSTTNIGVLSSTSGIPPARKSAFVKAVEELNAVPHELVARLFTGKLSPSDQETIFFSKASVKPDASPDGTTVIKKRKAVIDVLQRMYSRTYIRQQLTLATALDDDLVVLLLEDETVLKGLTGAGPAVTDFLELTGDGVKGRYFPNWDLTGAPIERTDAEPFVGGSSIVPPLGISASKFSVEWTGHLLIQAPVEIVFRIRCTDGVKFWINDTVVIEAWRDQSETEFTSTVALDGPSFCTIKIKYYNRHNSAKIELSWQSASIPFERLPQRSLFTPNAFEGLLKPIERVQKLAMLLSPFSLTARDLKFMTDRRLLLLDSIPAVAPVSRATANAIFKQWIELADFVALRNQFTGSSLSIVDVLLTSDPITNTRRLAELSGKADTIVTQALEALSVEVFDLAATPKWRVDSPDIGSIEGLSRVSEALKIVRQTGAVPGQLREWSRAREIDQTPAGPESKWINWTTGAVPSNRNSRNAQAVKDLVRARYDDTAWRSVATALNDPLRVLRRSALTAFVLAQPAMMKANVSNSERLFEFLLIDVEMDSCMDTSRIKQAISSVQLFIQRILLNLEEPLVLPSVIDQKRWEWMRHYRVWEAGRKVLFWPELVIHELLRDNKSPIFKEFESDLLQDELSEATVEKAFSHYLESLGAISKLKVCGSCVDNEKHVLHIFARTETLPFIYYHRWIDAGANGSWTEGVWSPWYKIPLDIFSTVDGEDSGTHLLPLMWNHRLHLFWLIFESKPDLDTNNELPDGFESVNQWEIRIAWSEFKDGVWSARRIGSESIASRGHNDLFKKGPNLKKVPYKVEDRVEVIVEYFEIVYVLGIPSFVPTIPFPRRTTKKLEGISFTVNDGSVLDGIRIEPGMEGSRTETTSGVHFSHLLPRISDHYIELISIGSILKLRIGRRFDGFSRDELSIVVDDVGYIIKNGVKTDYKDKKEEHQKRIIGDRIRKFESIGEFWCYPNAAANSAIEKYSATPFESLSRPVRTTNKFSSLRAWNAFTEWPSSDYALILKRGTPALLETPPKTFEVIDTDNRINFDRSIPFFYQDQQQSYLVTRNSGSVTFGSNHIDLANPVRAAQVAEKVGALVEIAGVGSAIASGSTLLADSWTTATLTKWSDGPSLPENLRVGPLFAPQMDRIPAKPTVNDADTYTKTKYDAYKKFGDVPSFWLVQPSYTFTPHWHPYSGEFISALNRGGMDELFALATQERDERKVVIYGNSVFWTTKGSFEIDYKPDVNQIVRPYPIQHVDFDRIGSYANYNWELFFHMPMTVAAAYMDAGDSAAAMNWIHRVCYPMTSETGSSAQRVWRFIPFRTANTQRIEDVLRDLSYTGIDAKELKRKLEAETAIKEWINNPFNPHLIARRRPVAYMKYVFFKYSDNLLNLIDSLRERGTIEADNEALHLCVLLANLWGPAPQDIPAKGNVAPETFSSLRSRLDSLSNAYVDIESSLPLTQAFTAGAGTAGGLSKLPQTLYFCMPRNEQLLAYWDKIADRLFKIRHCMSPDGTVRQLPLFEPAIDPNLLVEATAHGLEIGSVLNDLYAPLPRYRFNYMLQQALALCSEVRTLGNAVLSIRQSHDAERLAALRAEQEIQLLDQIRINKKLQINEAEESIRALDVTVQVTSARIDYYEGLIARGLIAEETEQLSELAQSNMYQNQSNMIDLVAQVLHIFPDVTAGTLSGSTFGGSNLGAASGAAARAMSMLAASSSYLASKASITGGHSRRAEDWRYQRDQAKRELRQVERQRAAAKIRKEITQADLRNHELQIDHSKNVEDVLHSKFTNVELFGVMVGRARAVYHQLYREAFEMAKAAERCWRYERGRDINFIKYGAWDSSIQGLLAGEQLYLQLKQMERAYIDHQVRDFEISKHVSLLELDPVALIALKETGTCEFELPEWLFDIDYPGHYFRRLETVSISIPAVVGRSRGINATLTLLSSKIRESVTISGSGYSDDENYRHDHLAVEAIAASHGQNDRGRFKLGFRDAEYGPFEGAGVISRWRVELPARFRSWDYETMTELGLDLEYTARRDSLLVEKAEAAIDNLLSDADKRPLMRLLSLRHEFPSEWEKLRTSTPKSASITITKDRFPILMQNADLKMTGLQSVMIMKSRAPRSPVTAKLSLPGTAADIPLEWTKSKSYPQYFEMPALRISEFAITNVADQNIWHLTLDPTLAVMDVQGIRDVVIILYYSAKIP
jgi:hypothetical protein